MPEIASNKNTPANSTENDACDLCPHTDKCRDVWAQPNHGPFNSGGLILASILAFIIPIITAVIAAAVVRHMANHTSQSSNTSASEILAALGGFIAGAAIAWIAMPILKKRFPANNQTINNCHSEQ